MWPFRSGKKSGKKRGLLQTWLGPSWSKAMYGAGGGPGLSGYYSTDPLRKVADKIQDVGGSANSLLGQDVYTLTRQLRQLERNNATVRAIVEGHLADNVGTGIGVVPDTGDEKLNARIREEWQLESESIGVCGESDTDLQRLWCREIDLSGNMISRIVPDESKTRRGLAPIAILPLELEWLSQQPGMLSQGNSFCAGIEYDSYGRPVAYHISDPNGNGDIERVSSDYIIHGFEKKRAQQSIGEPRLAAVIERSLQRARLIDSELRSAINASTYSTYLKSQYHEDPADEGDTDENGNPVYLTEFPIGCHANLAPGDEIGVVKTDRPNMEIQEFAKAMDGDLAGAAQVSRIWLTRDGSAYNFANSRFDQIRTNMVVKPWQTWFAKVAAGRVYEAFIPFILARLGVKANARAMRYTLQPDVPPETDEKSSAEALEMMLAAGVTTREEWCSQRGKDWRKVADQLAAEKKYYADIGIVSSSEIALESPATSAETESEDESENEPEDDLEEEDDTEEEDESDQQEQAAARALEVAAIVGRTIAESRKPIRIARDEKTGRIIGIDP